MDRVIAVIAVIGEPQILMNTDNTDQKFGMPSVVTENWVPITALTAITAITAIA
jgi:hypothetical protein